MLVWFRQQIKDQKKVVAEAESLNREFGIFEDCGDFYHEQLAVERSKLDLLISIRIRTEKYMKKLKHEEAEPNHD